MRRFLTLCAAAVALAGLPQGAPCQAPAADSQAPAADAGAPGEEAPTGVLTRAPEVIDFVEAAYPPDARARGLTGSVGLMITIGADGAVGDARIVEPAGEGFDEAALDAVRAFRFRPAEIDGQPAAVQVSYRYNFTLEQEAAPAPPPPPESVPTGRLTGRLREKGTRRPLVGLEVRLRGTERSAFTDAAGRFAFEDVPVGEVTLEAVDPQFADFTDDETIEAGKETQISAVLERDAFTDRVVVIGKRPARAVVRRTVAIEEIRTIPGTSGDALQVVQNLPGAARTPFGQTDIILRGGGLSQPFLNTQPIPLAFHFGGLRSTIAGALIESLDVYPGNYGVEFGRGNGGVVDIRLRRPADDGLHGYAEADLFDAGALVEGPVGDHGAFAVAVRRSYIDAILPAVLPADVADNLTTAPRYYDSQILYDWRDGPHRVRALIYGSSDRFVSVIDEPPEDNPYIRGDASLSLEWIGAQVEWIWLASEDVQNTANVGYLLSSNQIDVGPALSLDFLFSGITARDAVEVKLAKDYALRAGLDALLLWADIDAYGAGGPPKEGEPGVALGVRDVVATKSSDLYAAPAVWAEGLLTFGPVLVVPGFRADFFSQTSEVLLQPRLTTRLAVTEGTVLKGGVGLYAEAPDGDETDASIGNSDLTSEMSVQYSLGVEQRFTEALSIDVVGFFKSLDNLVTRVDDPQVRFANQGVGRAYGLEVLLRHDLTDRLYGWIAYTLQVSERRDAPGDDYRLFDSDQTHNVILIGQYKLTPTWTLGARWRYVSGNPTTPVAGAVFDADADVYVPLYGDVNSDRLPAFHQLDLRLDKWWLFDAWRLLTYLEIRNVYNQQNAQAVSYNFDFSQSSTQYELPFFPSIGVRGEW